MTRPVFFTPIPPRTVWCSILKGKTLILAENRGTNGKAICPASFTGHRGVTDIHKTAERLRTAIMECYNSGVRFFYVGGAVGFDTIAAEAVLHFREQFPDTVLIVVVPFPEQDKFFNAESRKRYREILDKAEKVVTISNEFSKVAYLMRNDYMVSHSCRVIAYWDGVSGSGTSYTVREAKKRKRSVQNLF